MYFIPRNSTIHDTQYIFVHPVLVVEQTELTDAY